MRENLGKICAGLLVLVGLFYLVFLGASAMTADFGSTGGNILSAAVSIFGGFALLIGPMLVNRFPRGGPAALIVVSLVVAFRWGRPMSFLFPLTVLVAAAAVYRGMEVRRNSPAAT